MNKIKANLKLILLVFKYTPLFAIWGILMIVIDVLGTLLDLEILEKIIELVTKGSKFNEVLKFIILIITIKIVLVILGSLYYGYIRTRGRNIWVKKIQSVIYKKASQRTNF